MKILFLYIPAHGAAEGGKDPHFFCMIMPVGLLALADLLHKSGHTVEIVHEGVETILDGKFSVSKTVRDFKPDLVAMSLHFHHQTASVEHAVRDVKKTRPETKVALGGFTASFFADEIMRKWTEVDYVVRGDGEAPLYHLARHIDGNGALENVPNLSFRRNGDVVHNAQVYCADEPVLDKLNFTNMKLLRHHNIYGGAMFHRLADGMSAYMSNRHFYLSAGRGCSVNCAYCAGAASSQRLISNRRQCSFRRAASLAEDVESMARYGVDSFYLCFDPPGKGDSPYQEFMELLRKENISSSMIFEYYNRLPGKDFISAFSDTFQAGRSAITFSPATTSEDSRKFFNGAFYSNRLFEKTLKVCSKAGIKTILYFTFFPGETMKDLKQSYTWAKKLSSDFGSDTVFMPIEMEPGAPWHLRPEKYGVTLTCRTFDDFLRRSRYRDFSKFPEDPGYRFPFYKNRIDFILSKGLAPKQYAFD